MKVCIVSHSSGVASYNDVKQVSFKEASLIGVLFKRCLGKLVLVFDHEKVNINILDIRKVTIHDD